MRTVAGAVLPGLATYAAWDLTLGRDPDGTYTGVQCVVFGLVVLVIGVLTGWMVTGMAAWFASASAALGTSVACWADWSSKDESGLFVIGWATMTVGAVWVALLLIVGTATIKAQRAARHRLER